MNLHFKMKGKESISLVKMEYQLIKQQTEREMGRQTDRQTDKEKIQNNHLKDLIRAFSISFYTRSLTFRSRMV